nr:unnamed protein product [Callosobruchus chinensis]
MALCTICMHVTMASVRSLNRIGNKMNVFYLVALSSICRKATGNVFIDMVSEVVKNYATIATVTEISCSKRELFSMLKKLSSSGYRVNVAISTESLEYPEKANRHMFVMSLECENSGVALEDINEKKLFAFPLKWIFYKRAETNTSFDKINVLLDSDVTLCTLQQNQTIFIEKIYKRHERCPIIVEDIGYWTPSGGLFENDIGKNMIRRRSNLMGTTLNTCIVITNNDSLNHLTDKRDKHIDSIAKVNYVLVEHLSDVINATLNYSIKPTWGYFNGVTSEWSTPLFFTIDRVDIIDYIAMTTPTRSKFVFREPKLSYVTNVFTLPFDTNVWLSTICMVVVISIALIVTVKWEWTKAAYLRRKNATEPIRRALYVQKVAQPGKPDNFLHLEEGVRKMREGLFAFHMETGPGYKIVGEIFEESEKCGLQEIQFLQVIDPWLAIQKNSSFKKILKIGLRKIHESGLQMREVGSIYTKKPICTSRGSTFISVGIVDCYPAAVVFAVGIVAAFAVFTVEIAVRYYRAAFSLLRRKFIVAYNGDSSRMSTHIHTIYQE